MLRRTTNHAREHYKAFYSSEFGGITLDPGCFFVPMDDRMVHKGHGVYETVLVVDGFMYQLPEHLERLGMSAEMGAVGLPCSLQQCGRIALECAALGQVTNGESLASPASHNITKACFRSHNTTIACATISLHCASQYHNKWIASHTKHHCVLYLVPNVNGLL